MKTFLLLPAFILMIVLPAKSQVYSTSQSGSANGLCVGCSIVNAAYTVDASITNYETMNLTVAVLGAGITQRLNFPSAGSATYYVGIVVEDVSGGSMNSTLLNSISLTSYKNGISNNDTKNAASLTISNIGGTLYKMEYQVDASFDALEVKFNAGILDALNSLRLYYGYYKVTSPLPVGLLSFSAEQDNHAVKLSWATATEQNNDHFTIERSADALTYESVGTIGGAGTSSLGHNYDFEDQHPAEGMNYYRLKQTDYDGHSKYYNVITANYTERPDAEYALYPNPASGGELHFLLPYPNTTLQVTGMDGKLIFSKQYADAGSYAEDLLQQGGCAKGLYFVSFNSGRGIKTMKLILR